MPNQATMKKLKIAYWIVTLIFALANLASGFGSFFPNQESAAIAIMLGYPAYLFIMLGVAKILGSIAVLQTKFRTIKEWAYAGFTFDYVGAVVSFLVVGGNISGVIFCIIFIILLSASYWLWKKVDKT
jgi:hypothetical protein